MVEKLYEGPLTGGPREENEVPRVEPLYGFIVGDWLDVVGWVDTITGEGGRERGREGGRERGREGGRERGREGGRERGREGGRERGREGGRERGRERGEEGVNQNVAD